MAHNFTESKKPINARNIAVLLWPYIKAYRVHVFIALAAVGVASVTMLLFGWGLKNLIDHGISEANGHYLNRALLALLGVITLLAASSYARFYAVYWLAERAVADLRKKIFGKLLSLDASWFENTRTGEEVSTINADTAVLQALVATNVPTGLRNAGILLGGIVMLCVVSPGMTGMVLLVVPLVVLPIMFLGRRVRVRSRQTQARIGTLSAFSHEALAGIQTIQSFGYESRAADKFSGLADDTFFAALRYIRFRAFLTAYVIFMVSSAIGTVLWMGGHKVLNGEITAGSLSAFVFYSVMVAGSVGALTDALSAFSQAAGAADRIIHLLSAEPALRGTAELPGPVRGQVAFDKVSFSYPTRPERAALHDVSFTVKPGEVVALVGPSGAGKSTVFQLLQRFYDPDKGGVLIDDHKISDYAPATVRRHMAVVSQDPAIFPVSIAENIRIGKPDATDDEVRHAAELAQAHEFVSALPRGYDTMAGERGSRLSGGQKQRIAIARAILKDAKILLLDEATSALDSSNEVAVHAALKNLMKGRTTLIIAHRLSTVQGADRIIVLDKGTVVAEGPHAALYGHDSLYTHLAGLQIEMKAG